MVLHLEKFKEHIDELVEVYHISLEAPNEEGLLFHPSTRTRSDNNTDQRKTTRSRLNHSQIREPKGWLSLRSHKKAHLGLTSDAVIVIGPRKVVDLRK